MITIFPLNKKRGFSLRILERKRNFKFRNIYRRNPLWKPLFFMQCPRNVDFKPAARISSFDVFNNEITRSIRYFDPNEAQGHDGIFIHILNLCTSSMLKLLFLLFNTVCEKNSFLSIGKKKIYFQFIKKTINSWSIIPVTFPHYLHVGKSFENIIFNSLFKYSTIIIS